MRNVLDGSRSLWRNRQTDRVKKNPCSPKARGMSGPSSEARGVLRLDGWRKSGSGEGALPDCALVVTTYKRPKEIVVLLAQLAGLPDPPGEVVVVDGSPDDSSAQTVGAWANSVTSPFEFVYVKSPPGLTKQRNVGIDASTKEFVFFLDDDCLPEPGYCREIRRVFREDIPGEVGAVCGSIVNDMGRPLTLRWRIRFLLRLVPRGESGKYYPTATSVPRSMVSIFKGTRSVDVIPGGVTAYRRAVLDRHRFSEFFSGYAQGEDVEMSLRIGEEEKLVWSGDAHVNHHHASGGRPPRIRRDAWRFETGILFGNAIPPGPSPRRGTRVGSPPAPLNAWCGRRIMKSLERRGSMTVS
jgi:GT2 family glycosyltransferase